MFFKNNTMIKDAVKEGEKPTGNKVKNIHKTKTILNHKAWIF